jgi:hypothetical protein
VDLLRKFEVPEQGGNASVGEYLSHPSNALEPMYLISYITQKHFFLNINYQQPLSAIISN